MNSVYKQEAHEVEAGSKCNSGFLNRCTQKIERKIKLLLYQSLMDVFSENLIKATDSYLL